MSGTVLSRTERHTAHSSGAARSTAALRRTATTSPATGSTAPAASRPVDGDRSAETDAAEADPAASPPPPAVPAPPVPGAALTVTLAIPLTGEALTPEAYRLLEALRDVVERGQGAVTRTTTAGPESDGLRNAVPRDRPGATRGAIGPTFSDAAHGDPVFSGPASNGPALNGDNGRASNGQAANGWAVNGQDSDARPATGSAFTGTLHNGQAAFGSVGYESAAAPAAPELTAAPTGPELADPDVLAYGPGRSDVSGASRAGVFRADVGPSDTQWARPDGYRPVEPTEVRLLTASRQVLVGGVPLAMTRLEFDLLLFLAGNPRRVFTRAQLLGAVWGYEHTGERTVDVHVRRLRVKMGVQVPLITTVYGVGYRLDDEARIVVVSHG